MLRHYDELELLSPEHVDPANGYRRYGFGQLDRLHRLVALRDLGFRLDQIGELLDGNVTVEQLRGMLQLRRAQIAQNVADEQARLRRVEAHLHALEETTVATTTPTPNIIVKQTQPIRVAEAIGATDGFGPEFIPPVTARLIDLVLGRLLAAGVTPMMSVARYELRDAAGAERGPHLAGGDSADGEIIVRAGFDIGDAELADTAEVRVTNLPVIEVASVVHHGPMDDIESSYAALLRWIDDSGFRTAGFSRELYLEWHPENPAANVTELQMPIARDS